MVSQEPKIIVLPLKSKWALLDDALTDTMCRVWKMKLCMLDFCVLHHLLVDNLTKRHRWYVSGVCDTDDGTHQKTFLLESPNPPSASSHPTPH